MLGDFIAGTVPVCNYILAHYQDVQFYFFMDEYNASIVKYFFPDNSIIVKIRKGNPYFNLIKLAIKYRSLNFDVGISPVPCRPRLNNLFLFILNCSQRFGPTNKKLISKLTLNHKYIDNPSIHVGLSSLRMVVGNSISLSNKLYPLMRQDIIKPYKLGPETSQAKLKILVEVSNNRASSQLDLAKIAIILNTLLTSYRFVVLISAKINDADKAYQLSMLLNTTSEIGMTTNFDDFISYVHMANIALVGDGGLAHILGALNKKVVALYGKTSVYRWSILSDANTTRHLYDSININNISNEDIINELKIVLNEEITISTQR